MKRVAIVGFDHLHAIAYLDVFSGHPAVELVGICDEGVNRALASERALSEGLAFSADLSAYSEWAVDGIYVGTTPVRHREIVELAAARGVHVMCDKPLATTLQDADAILQAVGEARVGLCVPFRPVFQEPIRLAMERLRSGAVGEVQAIYAVKYGRGPTSASVGMNAEWFLDSDQAGFGGFGDIGSHALDAMCRIVDSRPAQVYARLGSPAPGAIDDLGTAHLEFANGVHGVLSAGWVNPSASPRWLEVRFEVLTSTHTFVVSAPYREFEVVTNEHRRLVPWHRDDLAGHVDDFVTAMSGDSPTVSGLDGRANLVVLLAAYRSAAIGEPVAVPE
jgi:predicted dehydrogenase